jgi:hypothetical protein
MTAPKFNKTEGQSLDVCGTCSSFEIKPNFIVIHSNPSIMRKQDFDNDMSVSLSSSESGT